jgi:hypothetical protein
MKNEGMECGDEGRGGNGHWGRGMNGQCKKDNRMRKFWGIIHENKMCENLDFVEI